MSSENLENIKKSDGVESEREKPRKGRVVCAWCKKDMGEKEGLAEGQVSHGICGDCRKKYFPKKN